MSINEARPPRRLWPWVTIGALLLVAVVIAVVFAVTRQPDTEDLPTDPTVSSSPTTSAPTLEDVKPTGCLGGPNRDAEMVLAAQEAAPHTSNGAVEFATSFIRWAYQYPYPSAADANSISGAAVAEDAPTRDLAAFFATEPNVSGGLVPDKTEYYRSTVPGVWNLESYSDDKASIAIGTGVVVEGSLNPSVRGSVTVDVAWSESGWRFVTSEGTRTTEELYEIGTAYTEGC